MSSFIFDNFKKRFLTGGVPQTDTWHFIPVNEDFKKIYEHDDVKLYHYRNINDFNKANNNYLKFTLSPEAKKFNDELTTEYYVKGLKGFSLDEKKNWQPTAIWGTGILDGNKITRTWSKVLDDNDLSNKPMFVKGKNFKAFSKIYGVNLSGNTAISSYIESGGFYYIRSKDELTWFANRSNTGNNKIIGVLGDNIEGVINGDPIGKDEANPFQGILDGNGFTLKNISVECNNVDNGLVGVLGKSGLVKNFNIDNAGYANSLVCKKKLNLKHIKEDARDINAGILVGRNYGTIKNINALNMKHFNFYGFVPEVYSVTNKSDDYSWEDGKVRKKFDTSNSNYYLMNSFCVNSPGNVCPYIGYFAEGYYGEDYQQIANVLFYVTGNSALPYLASGVSSNAANTNALRTTYTGSITGKIWNLQGHNPFRCVSDTLTSVNFYVLNDTVIRDDYNTTATNWQSYLMGNWFGHLSAYSNTAVIADPNDKTIFNMAAQMAKSPTYYGLDNKGFYTCGIICNESGTDHYTKQSNLCYNTNLIQDTLGLSNDDSDDKFKKIICPSAYVQTSFRMNPLTRAAYNIGIIAGANYGTISSVSIKVTAQNTSNFVGFYGTIAGKQANGYINMVNVDVDNQFIWDGEDNSYNVTYKNTPILPQKLKQQFSLVKLYGGQYTATSNFDYYFSAFYDTDPSVNTATDITDDCVTYRLRPIIVAGGLFGRYIPTVDKSVKPGTNNFTNEGCYINGATVIYNDNFEATNWKHGDYYGNYKRLENAMGVIAGKCDVGTQGVGIYENEIQGSNKMFVTNSIFSAVSSVGPLAVAHPVSGTFTPYSQTEATAHKTNGTGLGYMTVTDDNNVTSVKSTLVNTKYIGIYEIKQNTMETMCINIDSKDYMASADELKTGKDTGYLYTSDYPFRILNDTDSIYYAGMGKFYPNNNFANQRTNGNEGNPGATVPVGYNKRNIASWLIHLEGCRTNISPAVILYDDYLNTWYDGNTAAGNWTCNGNYTTKRAWFVNTTETRVQDVFRNASTYGWSDTYAADYEANEIAAIQNTFDGYTFIRTGGAYGQMNYKANGIFRLRSNFEAWFTSLNSYHNPRQYEKNIMVWSSPDLCPGNFNDINADGISGYSFYGDGSLFGVDYLVGSTSSDTLAVTDGVLEDKNIFNRSRIDDFFYYTYTDTDVKYYTNLSALPLDDSLIQHEQIKFGIYSNRMGYYKTVDSENVPYRYSYYGIGENLSANQIRNRIIEKGTFTTTSVSSNKNFGGLLVIDSSGNNVMFLDNTNQAPLTGNAITYPTPLMDSGKQLLMLEVR